MSTSPAAGPAISHIGQIAVNVYDVDRASEFYQRSLGLPLLFRAGQLAFFKCGDTRLMLSAPEKAEFDHPCSILYFQVGDIKAAHAEMKGRGVNFIDEPHLVAKMPDHDLWMSFFKDSEGNTLALMCEVHG